MQDNYAEDKKMSLKSLFWEMVTHVSKIPISLKPASTPDSVMSAHRDEDGVLSVFRGQHPVGWIVYNERRNNYKALTVGGEVRDFTNEQAALGFIHEQYH